MPHHRGCARSLTDFHRADRSVPRPDSSADHSSASTPCESLGECECAHPCRADRAGCAQLDRNQLSTLPREIGDLQALEILSVSENQLVSVPREVGKLRSLRRLWVRKAVADLSVP